MIETILIGRPSVVMSNWPCTIRADTRRSLVGRDVDRRGHADRRVYGRGGLRSGMRQLLIGGGAVLLVYLIGRGVGALSGVQLGA
jgi:hypothetical protein